MNAHTHQENGFSLIELLVVMVIIAMMAGISLFALAGARESSRDARRKADLETIRQAIELYRSDCGRYPASLPSGQLQGGVSPPRSSCPSTNIYLSAVPQDPQSGRRYAYTVGGTGFTYTLCAALESAPNPAMSTSGCGSCGSAGCNYKTQN